MCDILLLPPAFQGALISVTPTLGGHSWSSGSCAANLTQSPSFLAHGLHPFPCPIWFMYFGVPCCLPRPRTSHFTRARGTFFGDRRCGRGGKGGSLSSCHVKAFCGSFPGSVLLSEAFLSPDQTGTGKTEYLGIACGSQFFSF